ncbi:MAG: cytochrome c biogenesis protein ResB [Bacillota bacterium]|nr:cytochrome c biogenesis protein ResB [Bacillota bacterium]
MERSLNLFWISRTMRSRRTALVLLAALALLLAARTVLPPKLWSPLLFAVLGGLLVSLSFCTLAQIKTAAQPPDSLFVARHRLGCWGSPLLHLALLILIVAGTLMALTETWGRTVLVEGETFTDRRVEYLAFHQGPWATFRPFRVKFRLERVNVAYRSTGEVQDFETTITLLDREEPARQVVIAGGHPLACQGIMVYRHLFGYAPIVRFSPASPTAEPSPTASRPALVILDTVGDLGEGERYEGSFTEPSSGRKVSLRFLPDYDQPTSRNLSAQPRQPALLVRVEGGEGSPGATFRGVVPLHSTLTLAGLTVNFLDYRRWASFTVVASRGKGLLFLGFALALCGAGLLYLFNPRKALEQEGGQR